MKLKYSALFVFLLVVSSISLFAQDAKLVYRLGLGPGIEGNMGLWGVNVVNELTWYITDRFSLNPSVTFFQSTGQMEKDGVLDFDTHSGIFTNLTAQFDLIKTSRDFRIGFNAGPSFQVGASTYSVSAYYDDNGNVVDIGYENEKHIRLGYVTGVTFGWGHKKQRRKSSISATMYAFDGYYGYFLMTTYKFGFVLK